MVRFRQGVDFSEIAGSQLHPPGLVVESRGTVRYAPEPAFPGSPFENGHGRSQGLLELGRVQLEAEVKPVAIPQKLRRPFKERFNGGGEGVGHAKSKE